jgi:hypothetical protein
MRFPSALALLGITSSALAVTFEAENALLAGGLAVATEVAGFSGTGYVTNWVSADAVLTFSVAGLVAGKYDITILYSAPYGNKYTSVSVNGASSVEAYLGNVTTTTWTTSLAGSFALTAGTNTVAFSNDWGYYLIDAITVLPTPVKPVVAVNVTSGAIAQAEDGIFSGGVSSASAVAGYSGSGYAQGFAASADSVTITLYSAVEALYDLVVTYDAPYGYKQTTMSLNGGGGAEVVLADTSTASVPWANATAGQVLLSAGNNTISFINDW